jgi:hypothetical protein
MEEQKSCVSTEVIPSLTKPFKCTIPDSSLKYPAV